MWTVFKVYIEFVTIYCFCFTFCGHEACGILSPWPGIKPAPPALEGEVLTMDCQESPRSFLNKHPVHFIFTSDPVTDFQELGQDVLTSTFLLGYTRFSPLPGLFCGSDVSSLFHLNCGAWISIFPILFCLHSDAQPFIICQISHVLKCGNSAIWNLHSTSP